VYDLNNEENDVIVNQTDSVTDSDSDEELESNEELESGEKVDSDKKLDYNLSGHSKNTVYKYPL
jgi:hypothetical protein